MKRSYREFIQDILNSINDIESFLHGVSFESFESNKEKTLAVIKLLEIIGEALTYSPA
jgi:uncharacterized protein with HEPN domain